MCRVARDCVASRHIKDVMLVGVGPGMRVVADSDADFLESTPIARPAGIPPAVD